MSEQKDLSDELECPVCGDAGYDKTGMALHFEDCEQAEELRNTERTRKRAWEEEYVAKREAKSAAQLASVMNELGEILPSEGAA